MLKLRWMLNISIIQKWESTKCRSCFLYKYDFCRHRYSKSGSHVGQWSSKTTAEYIQASSRVGREPGLVYLTYNVNKSRDRSHYEYFRSMHEGLYRYVEPTSVTPFSAGARKKDYLFLFFAYLKHFFPR